jgi:hypothetical protein
VQPIEILLEMNIFVGGHQDIESGCISQAQQLTVLDVSPTDFLHRMRIMALSEPTLELARQAFVNQHTHLRGTRKLKQLLGKTERFNSPVSAECRVGIENFFQTEAVCQVLEKYRDGHACPGKDRSSAEDFRVGYHELFVHEGLLSIFKTVAPGNIA